LNDEQKTGVELNKKYTDAVIDLRKGLNYAEIKVCSTRSVGDGRTGNTIPNFD
jgi:hypothetical protein